MEQHGIEKSSIYMELVLLALRDLPERNLFLAMEEDSLSGPFKLRRVADNLKLPVLNC